MRTSEYKRKDDDEERLLSEWDSILVSHPEIDNIVSELCDGSITLRRPLRYWFRPLEMVVRKCHQMKTTYS